MRNVGTSHMKYSWIIYDDILSANGGNVVNIYDVGLTIFVSSLCDLLF